MSNAHRLMTAEDLGMLKQPTTCRLSPDGSWVYLTVQSTDMEQRKYRSHLYRYEVATSLLTQLTFGEVSDGAVHFSPDGQTIAFLSNRGGKSGVWLMSVAGGEPRSLGKVCGSLSEIAWSPDDRSIAAIVTEDDPMEKDPSGKEVDVPAVRRITRMAYKLDGQGYLPKGD